MFESTIASPRRLNKYSIKIRYYVLTRLVTKTLKVNTYRANIIIEAYTKDHVN